LPSRNKHVLQVSRSAPESNLPETHTRIKDWNEFATGVRRCLLAHSKTHSHKPWVCKYTDSPTAVNN
jgi:hypothetical protein